MVWENYSPTQFVNVEEQRVAVSGIELKPFAQALLAEGSTIFSITQSETGLPLLDWEGREKDTLLFLQVNQLLWQTRNQDFCQFLEQTHPKVEALLAESPLFTALSNPDIQVTTGHNGTRPREHILQVAANSVTPLALSGPQSYVIRSGAYWHDVGKAVSAGLDAETVRKMMDEYEHFHHSFPHHDFVSVMVLESFAQDSQVQMLFSTIEAEAQTEGALAPVWNQLLQVILNHHMFEFEKTEDIDEFAQLVARLPTMSLQQVEAFLLTYCLAFADMHATPAYRQYWEEKTGRMWEVISIFETQWDNLLLVLKQVNYALSLASENYK